ncbi:MAG: ribulose-phosphate 3-epimerase [Treponema sp.]|uniref:ribulose-phosphate 3-epimerase n=1 Tax=Treponema sp. TaxID=166 RepID=UPI001B591EA8|nr:ribulose-phosphate 3-epimerase [Treponema sp.]MBP5402305.1 ribulose-phosphate 3-epimerase [Treponema sp.]MBR5933196.1 ribulose-phosphate 3-epimerase [Treponema sp.]
MKNYILAPSLLSADFADLGKAIKMIEEKNAGLVHIDVMDGSFVPEISYGQPVVKSLRPLTDIPFDVHLMVNNPERQIKSFAESGADYITFHYEAAEDCDKVIDQIHALNKKAGISIKPATSVSEIENYLSKVELVLVMTVEPGFGGQKIIMECVDKVKELVKLRSQKNLNFKISVDGGVNENTIQNVIEAGTDVIVSGSAFFSGRLS